MCNSIISAYNNVSNCNDARSLNIYIITNRAQNNSLYQAYNIMAV